MAQRRWPRSFEDRLTHPLHTKKEVWAFLRSKGLFDRRRQLEAAAKVPVHPDPRLVPAPPTGVGVTWVGHATTVIQAAGQVLVTDPVWSRSLPGYIRRVTTPGLPLKALPKVDGVLISHNHFDHLDLPTLRRLGRRTPLFVPAGLARWFRRRGFRSVTELDWWESVRLGGAADGTGGAGAAGGGLELTFVPVHHWTRRGLNDMNRTLWGGWVVKRPDGRRLFFAGDSAYGHHFRDIAARCPGIDVAVLPIGAYEPRWFMKNVHMDPHEAVQVARELGAPVVVPVHWGTFVLTTEPLLDPIERVHAAWASAGRPRENLWDLALGETRVLP